MVTAQLLTDCSNTLCNICANAKRISQGHVQNRRWATFSWPTLYNLDKFYVTCVSYRYVNLLAAHLSVAPPDGWGIKLVLVNDFKIFAETLQGWFL
jgi:hypothetical protein